MANIDISQAYRKSFKHEIQRSYNFLVTFLFNGKPDDPRKLVDEFEIENHNTGIRRKIEPHHVLSVTLPQFTFSRQVLKMGSFVKKTPVIDEGSLDLRIRMQMIEDERHTIGYFVQYLQNKNLNEYGVYRGNNLNDKYKEMDILVQIYKNDGEPVADYHYYDCFLLDATEPTYSYDSNEAIKYDLNFAADYYGVRYFDRRDEALRKADKILNIDLDGPDPTSIYNANNALKK